MGKFDEVIAKIDTAQKRAQGCEAGAKALHDELRAKVTEAAKAQQELPKETIESWVAAIDSNVRHAASARQQLKNAKAELRTLLKSRGP